MTPDQISRVIEELRELHKKATGLPWKVEPQEREDDGTPEGVPYTMAWMPNACPFQDDDGLYGMDDANAEYAAACANHMPAILDVYERAVANGAAKVESLRQITDCLANDDPGSAWDIANSEAESPSPGKALLDERDKLREQLEAAQRRINTLEGSMNPQDVADLFPTGGGE